MSGLIRRWTFGAGLWAVGFLLVSLVDHPLIRAASRLRWSDRVGDLLAVLKGLGVFPLWLVVALGLALVDRAGGRCWNRLTLERAGAVVTATFLAGVSNEGIKLLIRRGRPDPDFAGHTFRAFSERPFFGGGIGMPSGHTAVAVAGVVVLMRLFPPLRPLGFAAILGIAAHRVLSIAHFPSDVYAGATVGWLAVQATWWLHARYGTGQLLSTPPSRRRTPALERPASAAMPIHPQARAAFAGPLPELSIVVPAHDEAANLVRLLEEVRSGVIDAGVQAELIVVDDGSEDGTWDLLQKMRGEHPWLRPVRMATNGGQSLALRAGIREAAAPVIATLDADLQNDPADLPILLGTLRRTGAGFVQGHRADRRDTWGKRQASRIGRAARRLVLDDPVLDTGCSTRVVRAEFARRWPLELAGMHRFLPALAAMQGARIVEVPVNHRPRHAGSSHYGSLQRGLVGTFDLLAVRWMRSRHRRERACASASVARPAGDSGVGAAVTPRLTAPGAQP